MIKARDARHAAARTIHETSPVPDRVLAEAVGWTEAYLKRIAKAQGWRKAPASHAELARRARRHAERRLDSIEAQLSSGKSMSSASERALADEALKLHGALQAMERSARGAGAGEEQAKTDEELTDVLHKIDQRIVELAGELAARMVGTEHTAEAGQRGSGELAAPGATQTA